MRGEQTEASYGKICKEITGTKQPTALCGAGANTVARQQ
jgi:hypothetical protein